MGQGKTSLIGNLTASFPWLKNKALLIPSVAFVLVLSTVGVVSAVQGGVFSPSAQGTADTSLEDSDAEAAEQPAIGFACVAGTEICEEVKSILLNTDYEEVVTNWTRESLIAHLESKYGRSRIFATDVVDAVKFDWGDGSSYAGADAGDLGSDSESAGAGSSSGSGSGSASSSIPCIGSASICAFLKEIHGYGHFDEWIKEDLVSYIVRTYNVTKDKAEAVVDSTGYNWGVRGLPEIQRAAINYTADSLSFSRIGIAKRMRDEIGLDYNESLAALDALNIDWYQKARQDAERIASLGPISARYIFSILIDSDFLDDEAYKAVDGLSVDWYERADQDFLEFLQRRTPPCEFSYEQAFDYMIEERGWFEDEADFAIFTYLDIDENYNDVWLVCGP
jgi:hypothetical protein